jgi:hypothetical protein
MRGYSSRGAMMITQAVLRTSAPWNPYDDRKE